MSFEKKHRKVAEGVLKCLEIDPYAAVHPSGNPHYSKLILMYWAFVDRAFSYDSYDKMYYIHEDKINDLTSSESITRAYRKLLEESMIDLMGGQKQKRSELEDKYKEFYKKEG